MKEANRKKIAAMKRFFSGKGFYIVLLLCAMAVGLATYIAVKDSFTIDELLPEEDPVEQTDNNVPDILDTSDEDEPSQIEDEPEPSTQEQADPTQSTQQPSQPDESKQLEEQESVATSGTQDTTTQTPAQTKNVESYFIMPVEGTITKAHSNGDLVYSNTTKDYRTHNGIDIAASAGTKVKCIYDGTVEEIYDDELMGKTVVIKHEGDYQSIYCNLSPDLAAGIEVGAKLQVGDVIGGVGETAIIESAEASHLHFELKKAQEYVDPASVIS